MLGLVAWITWITCIDAYKDIYLHKCISLRDGGAYATCPIDPNIVIASFPRQYSNKNNMNDTEYSNYMTTLRSQTNTESMWVQYVNSLPTTCQSPIGNCGFKGPTTHFGSKLIQAVVSKRRSSIMDSVVRSRQWQHGLIPVLDMFNHHRMGKPLLQNTTHYLIMTAYYQPSGSQIYISYGNTSTLIVYILYGFIDYSSPFTCDDMRRFRIRSHNQTRIECIANSTSSREHMQEEKALALAADDIAMVQGAVLWLQTH